MAFDPSQFGATPVTSGFNPTQFGATPVSAPAASAVKPDSFLSMATNYAKALPGAGLGNAIGTSLYNLGSTVDQLAHGNLPGAAQTASRGAEETNDQFESGAGSAIESAALPASLALGGGTGSTALARLGSAALNYGAAGAVIGGSSAMANNGSASDVATGAAEGGLEGAAGGAVGQGIGEATPVIADSFKALSQKQTPLQQTIDALDPKLTPGKTAKAYQDIVTGNRTVTPPSIFQEQSLSPAQKTVNLGTRLQDIGLGTNPVQNLNKLGMALDDTESQLQSALKANPTISADKPALTAKLDDLKTQIPEEYKGIKESNTTFNAVLNYAKSKVAAAPDDVAGLRSARTAFDTQAKSDFPSAFKNGTIDTGTPAGRAIALARDTISEHTYNIAPNGSQIQSLIGREADIFRATEAIAPKAAKGEGANAMQQIIKAHPTLAKIVGYGLTAFGGGEVAKHLGL